MNKMIIALVAAFACSAASAGVIDFDDLPGDPTLPLDSGYAGFNWTNIGAIRSDAAPGTGFETGVVSPSNAAYNWYGLTATISTADGKAFSFAGADFTSAYVDQEISFEAYRNGELVRSSGAYTLDTLAPQWIRLDWAGIDTLVIYNSSGTQWAMDDFTVPEPATLGLFGGALMGLFASRRLRRRG
ncbi:PEP-CTERM sorting domain-containing protein [Massilia aerilata]|uniref:PEP-CTERM sorting domain-containing protein n=1 Tax=Massilia aerilata TaxID=453817 RepID=A0ABW0RSY9_9BURK